MNTKNHSLIEMITSPVVRSRPREPLSSAKRKQKPLEVETPRKRLKEIHHRPVFASLSPKWKLPPDNIDYTSPEYHPNDEIPSPVKTPSSTTKKGKARLILEASSAATMKELAFGNDNPLLIQGSPLSDDSSEENKKPAAKHVFLVCLRGHQLLFCVLCNTFTRFGHK